MIGLARSWLYVPASRPELLDKAMAGEADAVVYDLEDAVAADAKETARDNAVRAVCAPQPKPLWIRVNLPDSPLGGADLAALAETPPSGLRLPKVEEPEQAAAIAERVECPLHLLVESARGVANAFELADCHPRIASVSLGEADLMADLRVRDASALEWARQRVIAANRAAGLPNPPHAVWTDVADTEGMEADSRSAAARGFFGRSVVHPRQVAVVNRVFQPAEEEVRRARELVACVDRQAGEGGPAAWLDERGRFVDPAVVAGARWLIELADSLGHVATEGNRS